MPPKLKKKKSSRSSSNSSPKSLDLIPKASPITFESQPTQIIKRISNSIKSDLCDYYDKCEYEVEDTDLIIDLTLKAMEKYENENLTDDISNNMDFKKNVVKSSVEDCINCKINDEKRRQFLLDLQKDLTPAIVEIGLSASKTAIKFKLKLTTSNNCFGVCCSCCY